MTEVLKRTADFSPSILPAYASPAQVFDRSHLARYTMDSQELEREILSLFMVQLDDMLAALDKHPSLAEWKLVLHTLKGSALYVGAFKISEFARKLEEPEVWGKSALRQPMVDNLCAAVREFQQALKMPPMGI